MALTVPQIQAAMQTALTAAIANPQSATTTLSDGTQIITSLYTSPNGSGQIVSAVLPNGIVFSSQNGPETRFAVNYETAYAIWQPLLAAKAAKKLSLSNALKALLISQFNAWTPTQRAVMNGARLAINDMLTAGDIPDAITAVTEYPLPESSYATLQAAILADLNAYASKFAALQTAATIAAVNAVT
jgi:hypothetical protein